MYLDVIINKMIPGIFFIINNKTYEGYKIIFSDLLIKLKSIMKNQNNKLKIITYTTDYEISLYKAFYDVFFSECENLNNIGCYYHYLSNIEKNLRKYSFSKLSYKKEHDKIIKFFSELPFKFNINKIIDIELNF